MKKILLISGGMDSLLIYFSKKEIFDKYIYIDYGHRFLKKELEKIEKLGINFETIKISNLKDNNGFFYGRNLRFMIAVREKFINENIAVYFGNNIDDNYNDNTHEFLQRTEKIINDSYPDATFRICCPLKDLSKQEIMLECKKNDIDFYFCDSGMEEPCKKCHSCIAMIDAKLMEV